MKEHHNYIGGPMRKGRTYYQQIAAAVAHEDRLNATLIDVKRKHNKNYFIFKHKDGRIWEATLSKLENYSSNKFLHNTKKSFSYSTWAELGKKSKNFIAYQCYIVYCWDVNNKETFFKIGKTYVGVDNRLESLPYNYKVIKIYEGNAYYISKLERKLQKLNKEHQYIPNKQFTGMYECFSSVPNL